MVFHLLGLAVRTILSNQARMRRKHRLWSQMRKRSEELHAVQLEKESEIQRT